MDKKYTQAELSKILELHLKWLKNKEGGQRANLQGADLRDADLQGASLDFSCLPLWCGGSRFKVSAKFVLQLFAHISTLEIEDADEELKQALAAILPLAKKSHRARDLGLLGKE